jgi:hypothetical protein
MSLDEPCACERCCRTAAFGAIRRAVMIARESDAARLWLIDVMQDHLSAEAHRLNAIAVRCAIRAAIGSDKI